ncbi:MAG: hypothetical protein IPP72_16080 [Chitinophagaceae bacterium]|nr:hypothetical protein [Chitinophagaceae bacterium]
MESTKYVLPTKPKYFGLNLGVIAAGMVLIMVFIMGLVRIYSPDLGFHLKSAQWMLENKQFIYTDSFDYGSTGNKYFNLQWLFQLFVYSLYHTGEKPLVIINAALITVSIALVWFRFSKNTGISRTNISLGLFAFIVLLLVQPLTFEVRPHVLSWIYLNLVLICLEFYKRNGNKKSLYFLPIIMLVWVNTHSLSILGLATIAIYNAGIYLENGKIDKRLFWFSVMAFAAFLINPYFLEGLIYPFLQFGLLSGSSMVKAYFAELQSPFTAKEIGMLGSKYFTSPLLIIHLSALFSVFSIARSFIKKQFTDALLMAAYLFVLYLAHKNYGYFLMVSLPLIVKYTMDWVNGRKHKKANQSASSPLKKKNKEDSNVIDAGFASSQKLYKRFTLTAIIAAVVISITSITDGYSLFRHSPYRFGFTEDTDQLPVQATAFLNKNQLKGRMLNHLDFGGYLMAHFNEKVFIDGRMDVLPEDFFNKYVESLTEKNGIKKLLVEYNPDIVIFPYVKASNWWYYFILQKEHSGYKPVYFDGLAVIYLKSAAYPLVPALTDKTILNNVDVAVLGRINESIQKPKSKGVMVLIKGLWQKQSFSIADQNKATYCFTNGFDSAALSYSVTGIEKSTIQTPNIYKNLALYFNDKKIYDLAQICEDKAK